MLYNVGHMYLLGIVSMPRKIREMVCVLDLLHPILSFARAVNILPLRTSENQC